MSARLPNLQERPEDKIQVFSISPLLLLPSARGDFAVFLKQGGRLVLYTSRGEAFTQAHRTRLTDLGVRQVYVRSQERSGFASYIQDNLAGLLDDASIPLGERVQTWYDATRESVRGIFDERLPQALLRARMQQVQEMVRRSALFFATTDNLRHIARLVGKGYGIWDHSLATMVFTACVMQTYEPDPAMLERVCMGALLHDIGKTRLPAALLERREGMSEREAAALQTHPAMGAGLCAGMPLAQESVNCILFHHERDKGGGYPSGLTGEDIPEYVKALAVCDAYDNMTRTSGNRSGRTPFEALTVLNSNRDIFATEPVRRLVLTLSSAKIA